MPDRPLYEMLRVREAPLTLPPFGFGGSGGRSGAIAAQRSSGTRGAAIVAQRAGPSFVPDP